MDLIVVLASFMLILVFIKKGLDVGLTLFMASLFLIFLLKPMVFINVFFEVLSSYSTWYLILTSSLIAFLAELYRLTTLIRDLGLSVARVLRSPKLAIVITPAIIGLLPVAGGALMSAPIVEALSGILGFNSELAVYANVWFRHTIFLVYPLSSLMVTISALTGTSIESLIFMQFPTSLFMILIGYLITFHRRGGVHSSNMVLEKAKTPLWFSIMPLFISLFSAIFLRIFFGDFGMTLGVFLGVLTIIFICRIDFRSILKAASDRRVRNIAFTAFSTMLLQKTFTLTGASSILSNFLRGMGIPLMILEYFIPGVLGLFTGSPLTGIVLSLPIIGGFIDVSVKDISRVYISSYLFYIASPIHLCYVYTAQYFNSNLSRSYRYLIPSVLASLIFTIVLYSLT
ncbi:MAG: DUF401 family protein [Candidatus Methanomethylicia archaeon]